VLTLICIVLAVYLILRLVAVRRHDRVLEAMYAYRRALMDLLRSERVYERKISRSEYLLLRKTLENANLLIDDFEKRRPSPFGFFWPVLHYGKRAFRTDVRQERQEPALNEEVRHHQEALRRLVSWSVHYLTPAPLRWGGALRFLLWFDRNHLAAPTRLQRESYAEWLIRQVRRPLTKDFPRELAAARPQPTKSAHS